MVDSFDEDLKQSLAAQASRVPGGRDLGRSAITRAHVIRRRRRVVGSAAAAALVAVAVPLGLQVGDAVSRSDGEIAPATPDPNGSDSLTFTREDGSTFVVGDAKVTCGGLAAALLGEESRSSQGDPSSIVVTSAGAKLFDKRAPSFFIFEGDVESLSPGTTITLPPRPTRGAGARLFAVDAERRNELTSSEEGSSGSIIVERASCDPVPEIEVRIDATLASELPGRPPVHVEGTLALRADPASPDPTVGGTRRINIDLNNLPAGDPPAVPYVEDRTVVIGDTRIPVEDEREISAMAAFDGGAHVSLCGDEGCELVRVTPDGAEGLGATSSTPIASGDLRWNAYTIGEQDITLVVYDSADGTTSSVELPDAMTARMFAVVDGTVFFRAEGRDAVGFGRPLLSWSRGQDAPTVVPGEYDATAVSSDGQLVGAVTQTKDRLCSRVVDRATGSALWETCDGGVLRFSPDGSYVWSVPPREIPNYTGGYSSGDFMIRDGATGEVVRLLPPWDNEVDFVAATFEDDDHLLLQAEQPGQTALVRCTVSTGECELATPVAQGVSTYNPPYLLPET
jgi:hypothetical protein